MNHIRTKALLLVALTTSSSGQTPASPPAKADLELARKRNAFEAFKTHGPQAALELVRSGLDANDQSRRPELQLGDHLRDIAHWLANEKHPRAVEAALLAVNEGGKAKGRITPAEEADLAAEFGRIYEMIVGDLGAAKARYHEALRLNPRHTAAARGAERIAAAEKLAAAKAAENEALRLRKLSPGPRP